MSVKILITDKDTFTSIDGELEIGRYYEATEYDEPTDKQNKTFHALLQCWLVSGCSSYDVGGDFKAFKDNVKKDYGAGFNEYVYVNTELKKCRSKTFPPVEEVAQGADGLLIWGKLKSWADYTRKERTRTIDAVISAMIQSGVSGTHFDEILKGLENGSKT